MTRRFQLTYQQGIHRDDAEQRRRIIEALAAGKMTLAQARALFGVTELMAVGR